MEELNLRKRHCPDCGALPPTWSEWYFENGKAVWKCQACDARWMFDDGPLDHAPSENSEVLLWLEECLERAQQVGPGGIRPLAMDALDEMVREYKFMISSGITMATAREARERHASARSGSGDQG
jgi:hypothetical protein